MIDKIFITGGTGFIGQHLIQLIEDKFSEIFVLTLIEEPEFWCNSKNVHLVCGDLNKPETYLNELSQCSILVHLAAEVRDENKMIQTNVDGVEVLTKAALDAGIKKIIHLSSVGVVGAGVSLFKRSVNEQEPCIPQNKYEITKLESERIFLAHKDKYKLVILRPTNVFGDHHPRNFLLSLLQHARKGKTFVTTKKTKFNYVYVGDLAGVIAETVFDDLPEGIYNVGAPFDARTFFEIIRKSTNSKSKLYFVPTLFFYVAFLLKLFGKRELFGKIVSLANKVEFSDSAIKNYVDYKFGIEDGIRRTVDYYEQSGYFKN